MRWGWKGDPFCILYSKICNTQVFEGYSVCCWESHILGLYVRRSRALILRFVVAEWATYILNGAPDCESEPGGVPWSPQLGTATESLLRLNCVGSRWDTVLGLFAMDWWQYSGGCTTYLALAMWKYITELEPQCATLRKLGSGCPAKMGPTLPLGSLYSDIWDGWLQVSIGTLWSQAVCSPNLGACF